MGPTQCKVTPGDAAKGMVLTMSMGPERPVIENVASRFENEPLPLYFGSVEKTTDLDSDMLARTLTKIHEADENKLFMSVSSAIRTHFGVKSRVVHSDTTSVSVYGEYNCYDENNNGIVLNSAGNRCTDNEVLYITRGYSKDHRPDLKQYMLGDAVDDNGIPIASNVLDGNTADSKWNTECLELLKKIIRDEELIYVADSKLVNDPLVNLMVREKVWFISRYPANFNDSLLERTLMSFDLNGLTPIKNISPRKDAAERRICSTTIDYNGETLRAVLVETSTLAGKGKKSRGRRRKEIPRIVEEIRQNLQLRTRCKESIRKIPEAYSILMRNSFMN